jgi:hypothetical protein
LCILEVARELWNFGIQLVYHWNLYVKKTFKASIEVYNKSCLLDSLLKFVILYPSFIDGLLHREKSVISVVQDENRTFT